MAKSINGRTIAVGSQAGNDGQTTGSGDRDFSEILAGENVGKMHLDHWCRDGGYGIGNGQRIVGVGSGIDHDAVVLAKAAELNPVDDLSFVVALEIVDRRVGAGLPDIADDGIHVAGSIDGCLTDAGEIQVWSVDDEYFHFESIKKKQQETEVYSAASPLSSAVRTGLEPATPCVTGMYSNQAELPHQESYFDCSRGLFPDCECKVRMILSDCQIF